VLEQHPALLFEKLCRVFLRQSSLSSRLIYTFVEQVRSHGKDPFAYFEWVFDKLMRNPSADELPDLLPSAWLETQREPAVEAVA